MTEVRESETVELDPSFADMSDDDYPSLEEDLESTDVDQEDDQDQPLDTEEAPGEETPAPKADQSKKPAQPKVDAKGNLHRPEDGKFAGKGTDTAQVGDEGQQLEGEPAPEPDPNAAPPARPEFTFRADQKAFRFPGSRIEEDGSVVIPKDFVPDLKQLLSEGAAHRGSFRQQLSAAAQRAQRAEQRAIEAEAEGVKARTFLTNLRKLYQQGPEAVAEWLDGLQANWPRLEAEATLAQARHLKEQASRSSPYRDEQAGGPSTAGSERSQGGQHVVDDSVLVPNLIANFQDWIESDPQLGVLDEDDLNELAEDLRPHLGNLYMVAEDDNPEGGYVAGEILIQKPAALGHLQRAAAKKRRLLGQREAADKAAETNQRRTTGNGNPVPPSAGGKGSGAKGPARPMFVPKLPKKGDKAAMEEWLEKYSLEQQLASQAAGIREE